jgi:putative FmdB family regulatory protein
MPTYTYECKKCGKATQVFHPMTATPRIQCDKCGSRRMARILGTGAGIIFKGGGFYETDYKKGKDRPAKEVDKAAKPEKKSDAKDTKSGSESTSGSGNKPKSTEAA